MIIRLLCLAFLIGTLPGQGVRYRDPVFPQVNVQAGLAYGSALNPWSGQVETLRLDAYAPQGDVAPARPAVVVVHGGGFVGGSRAAPQIVSLAERFAQRGYVAVSISYRLAPSSAVVLANPEPVIEDAMEDFKAAVRFLRSMAGPWRIDGNRIAATGSSAGGFTVLAGAYLEGEGNSGNPGFSSEVQVIAPLWGGLLDVNEMEAGEAPVILVHGTLDPVVPFVRSQDVFDEAQTIGIPSELHPIVGAGHGPWGQFFAGPFFDVVAFWFEHLKLGQLEGLRLDAGAFAAGTLILDSTGVSGDERWLGVATGEVALAAGALGTLCLDPVFLVLVPMPPLSSASRLPTDTFTAPLPVLPPGTQFWLQELHQPSAAEPRLLTNCVTLQF